MKVNQRDIVVLNFELSNKKIQHMAFQLSTHYLLKAYH